MAWTPENLTDPAFVQTQLTPLDRSNALLTMTRNLSSVQSKLIENKATLAQIQDQTNGPYSFATVRAARSAATAAAAQGDPNAAALQVKYEELQAKRQDLNGQDDRLIRAIQSGEEAIQTSQTAISNLEAAGAVPPGTNTFTPPPGYTASINPPAQVPDSQNPSPVPQAANIPTTTATPATIPLSAEQQRLLEANQADAGTIKAQNQAEFDAINPSPATIQAQKDADLGELGLNSDQVTIAEAQKQADLGELGINTDQTADNLAQAQKNADLGELGVNTDQAAANLVQAQQNADLGELGINTDKTAADLVQAQRDADLGELGINTAQTEEVIQAQRDAEIGELGINTDQVIQAQKQADLGELGINTDQVAAQEAAALGELGINTDPGATGSSRGLQAAKNNAQAQATTQDVVNFNLRKDWRVKLQLAPGATYLYKDSSVVGILKPLIATDGIIFPYTPSIQVAYAAHYDASDITHSNYKIFQYKNSSVDSISISCDFTAQDTYEANYLLAVIHFFRSITKMFYGQDQNPKPGVPPPLCYLTGLGALQFDRHPIAITAFNYSLPIDVDYIRASNTTTEAGVSKDPANIPSNTNSVVNDRLQANALQAGGIAAPPTFKNTPSGTIDPTYVPTKMSIQISAIPIVTRNDISNNFSLKKYATGELTHRPSGGGIW